MRLLLDTCVWGKAVDELRSAGHDVEWVGDWSEDPGDDRILEYALAEARVLVTLDKDFGELAVLRKQPHCGIVRLLDIRARQQARICGDVISTYQDDLQSGALITVRSGTVRIRSVTGDGDTLQDAAELP